MARKGVIFFLYVIIAVGWRAIIVDFVRAAKVVARDDGISRLSIRVGSVRLPGADPVAIISEVPFSGEIPRRGAGRPTSAALRGCFAKTMRQQRTPVDPNYGSLIIQPIGAVFSEIFSVAPVMGSITNTEYFLGATGSSHCVTMIYLLSGDQIGSG